jgi:hypothetical protein
VNEKADRIDAELLWYEAGDKDPWDMVGEAGSKWSWKKRRKNNLASHK